MEAMRDAFHVSPDALARELDGEVLVLDLRSSLYFGMTGTGARIWRLIEAGEDRDAILATLAREYGVGAEAIEGDVDAFLADLIDRGLVGRAVAAS